MDDVVGAEQIHLDDSFWQRLDGDFSVGLNYTKASDILTWNVAFSTRMRTTTKLTTLELDSTVTQSGDVNTSDTNRNNITLSRQWFLRNYWFWFSSIGAQQNEELGLKSRVYLTAGPGRFLIQNQKTELYVAAGLSPNREVTTEDQTPDSDQEGSGSNLESAFTLDWTYFKLYSPKSNVHFNAQLYPSITNAGRIRGDMDLSLRQEFVKDLFLDLSIYYDYDSDPLSGANSSTDFGVVTSIGYSF